MGQTGQGIKQNWHNQPIAQVMAALDASPSGLSKQTARSRLQRYGANCLQGAPRRSAFIRFILQFHHLFIYILIMAAIVTLLWHHIIDTFVIVAAIFLNAIIGFIHEGKAETAMAAIRQMLAPKAKVIRDNELHSILAEKLVPGDIVLLDSGDKVPADLRLISCHDLQIQEAILTGESFPVIKDTQPIAATATISDQSNMAFSGTLVMCGQGKGVVVATGAATEIGHIGELLSQVEPMTSPLIKQIGLFSRDLTLVILVLAALLLAFGYFIQDYPFVELLMIMVGFSVAAIPEGLPAVLSITMAIGVRAMIQRHVIVRHLPAIETLGSVSVICTDKTGTLTRNEMTVATAITHQDIYQVKGLGYGLDGDLILNNAIINPTEHPIMIDMACIAALCNNATLHEKNSLWTATGDPMEGALLTFAAKVGLNYAQIQHQWKRTDTISFDSKHRFMATLNHHPEQQDAIFVKGAPEHILNMCKDQRVKGGGVEPLNKQYWDNMAATIAQQGQRVLGLAQCSLTSEHTTLTHEELDGTLTFVGLLGLLDPAKPETITAVAECQHAGIRIKMITGDHAGTAMAIAKQIGLKNSNKVLTGTELDEMDDPTFEKAALDTDIFARTSPEHKLRLVMALQKNNMIVAMTGDGVNDAPALKRADIGIAMGKNGCDATQEAAELVLIDNNFSSIMQAVREGRTVYDNLKKVISWTLPTNAGEAMTIVFALLCGMTLPITPIQILWLNLITEVTLGTALAFEPTEENILRRPPRPRHEPLLTRGLVWHIILVSVLFLFGVFGIYFYGNGQGYPIEVTRTMVLNTLVVLEIFHLFFIRTIYKNSLTWQSMRGTKAVWLAVIIVAVAQLAITYLPPFQAIFATQAISLFDGILIIGIGLALFVIVSLEKQLRKIWAQLRKPITLL